MICPANLSPTNWSGYFHNSMMEPVSADDPIPPLECNDILYRTVSCDHWVEKETGKIRRHAFRRRPVEKKGLSVDIAARRALQVCIDKPRTKECHAIGSLHTGQVKDLSAAHSVTIDVVPDTFDHANIIGLPFPGGTPEEDKLREDLAQALADQCRPVWYHPDLKKRFKIK